MKNSDKNQLKACDLSASIKHSYQHFSVSKKSTDYYHKERYYRKRRKHKQSYRHADPGRQQQKGTTLTLWSPVQDQDRDLVTKVSRPRPRPWLNDRGKCTRVSRPWSLDHNTGPKTVTYPRTNRPTVWRPGIEPTTIESYVRRSNHKTIEPPDRHIEYSSSEYHLAGSDQ